MTILRHRVPLLVALLSGWVTLLGLLLFPQLGDLILGWAAFLAAVALVLGVLNLFIVHLARARRSGHSIALLLAMLLVFALAITDSLGITENRVADLFFLIQAPLEAALASLLAFFLLFIGVRLFRRERTIWSALFLIAAVFLLLSGSALPEPLAGALAPVREALNATVVVAGVRGILIGVALGILTFSLRLLAGLEQPYNK